MNGVRYFVDSNVLLYRYDDLSPVRSDRAKRAWYWTGQTQVLFWDRLIAAERTIGSITISDHFRTSPPVS